MEFDQIIAPLTREDFFTDYWEKNYLHVKGARGRFAALLTWDDLNDILENRRLSPQQIKLVREGSAVPPSQFFYTPAGAGSVPRIDSGRMIAALASGASLLIDNVAELSPRVRALSDAFRDALQAKNGVNLYAGWHSQRGFDLHWDDHGVMVLQVYGRKRWQVFRPTRDYPVHGETPPKPTGAPILDVLLEDGDVLYLPRGWWHVAYPINEPSLHLTVGIIPVHGMELVQWALDKLRAQPVMRKNLPALRDAATRKAHIAAICALLENALAEDPLDEFMREVWVPNRARPHIRLPQAVYGQAGRLLDEDRILLAAGDALSFAVEGEVATFEAYGRFHTAPASVLPALALLGDTKSWSVAELATRFQNDATVTVLKEQLTMMARLGIVIVEKG